MRLHGKDNRGIYCCCEISPQYTEYTDPLKRCEYHVNQKDCTIDTDNEGEKRELDFREKLTQAATIYLINIGFPFKNIKLVGGYYNAGET